MSGVLSVACLTMFSVLQFLSAVCRLVVLPGSNTSPPPCPSGYITGNRRATLGVMEEEWGTLMFFMNESEDRRENLGSNRLVPVPILALHTQGISCNARRKQWRIG